LTELLHQFSAWYLAELRQGGYPLIALLMTLESTLVPLPSELIIPPAAFLAQSTGGLSIYGIIGAGTAGSWFGATLMYWTARGLGRPLVLRLGPYVGVARRKVEGAERWANRYGWGGVFFSRLLPVIRHLIGIPAGIVRLDFRWYSLATLAGSLSWCAVLAWLGVAVGQNRELLAGSLHRFFLLVCAAAAVLAALYYLFVHRPSGRGAAGGA
jgi:membrane protein DedA with SNARE-associated domain